MQSNLLIFFKWSYVISSDVCLSEMEHSIEIGSAKSSYIYETKKNKQENTITAVRQFYICRIVVARPLEIHPSPNATIIACGHQ